MFFNPLFVQTTGAEDPTQNIKQMKLSKDSYLFSDIIKLNYEKSKVGESDLLGSTSLNELKSAVSSGTISQKNEVLDSFVGMPSLEMFTIVEPKVLNSLVEKVFQSNSKVSGNDDLFVLNKDVDVAQDLKSEIYGSEEKLVEFLEQLLPGMALVDTSKPINVESSKDSESEITNLPLLPLPEKENVVEDVLKRLKSGEKVQIIAKVGDEKIKLDITKIKQTDDKPEIFSNNFSVNLNDVKEPDTQTASVANQEISSGKIIANESAVFNETGSNEVYKNAGNTNPILNTKQNVPGGKIIGESAAGEGVPAINNKEAMKTPEIVEIKSQDIPATEKVSEGKNNTGEKFVVKNSFQENIEVEFEKAKKETKPVLNNKKPVETDVVKNEKVTEDVKTKVNVNPEDVSKSDQVTASKETVKVSSQGFNKSEQDVKQVVKTDTEKTGKVEIKESDTLKNNENTKPFTEVKPENEKQNSYKGEISKEDVFKATRNIETKTVEKTEVKQQTENKPVDNTTVNKEAIKLNESNSLGAIRNNFHSKSFNPLKRENESSDKKYKIEITQESKEDNTHEVFKKSNLEVDNLMNYKNQSSRVSGEAVAKEGYKPEQNVKDESASSAKENSQAELKVEKPNVQVKVSQPSENVNTAQSVKPESGVERVLKNTGAIKEIVKTVKNHEVVKEIKTFIQNGENKTMILKIMPENLGKVKVMIDMTDNHQVQANIEVENESVKQLIMTNVETLKQSITQSGIQLGGFSVSLNNPEGKMKREYEQKKKEQGGQQDIKVDKVVTEEIKEKKLGYNTYEYLA